MIRTRQVGILAGPFRGMPGAAAICAAIILAPHPALAFSLFGFHLWGAEENEDRIEVIDPLPYTVDFRVDHSDEGLERALRNASALWTNRDDPASGKAGLITRAKGDYRRLLAALYNAGYYGGEISITLAGREAADLGLDATFPQPVPAVVSIRPGPPFTFGALAMVNPPPPTSARRQRGPTFESIGFQTGEPARATVIDRASTLAVAQWRDKGHAKARETETATVANHVNSQLDVTLAFDPGPEVCYGPLAIEGRSRVDHDFIRFMTDLPEGRRFRASEVENSQARLGRLGVFRSFRIEEGAAIGPGCAMPMTARVDDRAPRTIGFGGTLSTLDGLGVEAYWLHRNLFGQAERLRFDAGISGLGVAATPNDLDYTLGVSFTKPGVISPDTNFVTGALARQLDFDTYRERSVSGWIGLTQQFGNRLTGDIAANASRARYEDVFGTRHFTIYGLAGNIAYDVRNDPLNATRGYYVAAMAQPFYEAVYDKPAVRGTIEGRIYHSLVGLDRLVLAGRAKFGTYWGPSAAESPPDLLFFAGGGGSVRGYAYRSIGVEIPNINDTGESGVVGGRGLFEASAEARYRINESWGAAGFVDSGLVTENPKLSGNTDLRFGVGGGIRYFTAFGPLRLDLATPIDRRPGDSLIALYIGIGQAF